MQTILAAAEVNNCLISIIPCQLCQAVCCKSIISDKCVCGWKKNVRDSGQNQVCQSSSNLITTFSTPEEWTALELFVWAFVGTWFISFMVINVKNMVRNILLYLILKPKPCEFHKLAVQKVMDHLRQCGLKSSFGFILHKPDNYTEMEEI